MALAAADAVLVTAESCTGGWIAKLLTDVPGSSSWFERGFVTYSNAAKCELLDVSEKTLAREGAVSETVAAQMASGALRASHGTIAVSVTGIAGPDGGTPDKPVGTVCFAWCERGGAPRTQRMQFAGDRAAVRLHAAQRALQGVLEHLE